MPHKDRAIAKEYQTKYNIQARRIKKGIPIEGWPTQECQACNSIFKPRKRHQINCSKQCYLASAGAKQYQKHYRRLKSTIEPRYFLKELLRVKNRFKILTIDNLVDLWEKQKGICALSGFAMTHIYGSGRQHTNASIDRIDNTKGYEITNIRLVCTIVNTMRNTMIDAELIEWCQRIVNNNKENI